MLSTCSFQFKLLDIVTTRYFVEVAIIWKKNSSYCCREIDFSSISTIVAITCRLSVQLPTSKTSNDYCRHALVQVLLCVCFAFVFHGLPHGGGFRLNRLRFVDISLLFSCRYTEVFYI